ncbi:hypothetical protein BLX88_23805, partial [Bacillus obstructivus]
AGARNRHRLGHQRDLVAIEIFHECGNAAFIIKLDRLHLFVARIVEIQPHARIEESELAIAMVELVENEFGDLEGGGAREEGDARALAPRRGADDLERRHRIAEREAHVMFLPVAPDRQIEPFGQRIDHRHA